MQTNNFKPVAPAAPPEIQETAIFINSFDGQTMRVEIAVLTNVRLTDARADEIKPFVLAMCEGEVQQLAEVLGYFSHAATIGVWVDLGFYFDDNATNHT